MEIMYGFIDENNNLVNTTVVNDDDLSILDTLLTSYNAAAFYPFNVETDIISIGDTKWNGVDWEPKRIIPNADTEYIFNVTEESTEEVTQ